MKRMRCVVVAIVLVIVPTLVGLGRASADDSILQGPPPAPSPMNHLEFQTLCDAVQDLMVPSSNGPFTDDLPSVTPFGLPRQTVVGATYPTMVPRPCSEGFTYVLSDTGSLCLDPSTPRFTVAGRATYPTLGIPEHRPIKWAKVIVYSVGVSASSGLDAVMVIGEGLTDARGDFRVDSCHLAYPNDPSGPAEILVQVALQSSALSVGRYLRESCFLCTSFKFLIYSGIVPQTFQHPRGTGALQVGEWSVPEGTELRNAAYVYSWDRGMMRSWDFLANTIGYVPSGLRGRGLEVHYLPPYPVPAYEDFPHYHVGGTPCGLDGLAAEYCGEWDKLATQIHIPDMLVAREPNVLTHLYAHFVMEDLYRTRNFHDGGLYYPRATTQRCYANGAAYPCYGDFNNRLPYQLYDGTRFKAEFDPGTAFAEGWADFFAAWVFPPSDGVFQFGHPKIVGGNQPSGYVWDFDQRNPSQPSDPANVEWSVAASLIDIVDGVSDGYDTHQTSFQAVWRALSQAYAFSIHDFWANFVAANAASDQHGAKSGLYENGFDKDQLPTIDNVQPSDTGWYSGAIVITAQIGDPDTNDNGFLDAYLYYRSPTGWQLVGGNPNQPSGTFLTMFDTSTVPDGNRPFRISLSDHLKETDWDWSINIDNSAQRVLLRSPSQLPWQVDDTPTFTWSYSGSGAPVDHADLYIYDAPGGVCSSTERARAMGLTGTEWTWPGPPISPPTTAPMADGQYCWKVVSTDTAGNVAESDRWLLKVDATGPAVGLTVPANGYSADWNYPLFQWTVDDGVGSGVGSQRFKVCSDQAETTCRANLVLPGTQRSYGWGWGGQSALADQTWYWSVEATDVAGHSGKTQASFANTLPWPIVLHPPSSVGWCQLVLTWEPSVDPSFSHYETFVRRSDQPTATYYSTIQDPTTTAVIRSLQANRLYYFHVDSVDDVSARFSTSEVPATTLDKPAGYTPQPVTLSSGFTSAYLVDIHWTQYAECDFGMYEIHRVIGRQPDFVPDGTTLLASTTDQTATDYYDGSVLGCTDYTYKVRVVTVNGDLAVSNPAYASTECYATFTGYVLLSDGAPLEGATMTVRRSSDGTVMWQGQTNADGWYESKLLSTTILYDLEGRYLPVCFMETRYNLRPSWQQFTVHPCI